MTSPRPLGPYTPVVRAGDWVVVSGQVGVRSGALVDGGVVAQLNQALANMRELLEQQGASLEQVVKCTVFLTDIADFAAMNAVWDFWAVPGQTPARATVQAKLNDPKMKVEIMVVAAR